MNAKEKKAYLAAMGIKGEVIVYNERDDINNIKTYEEVSLMPFTEGQAYIEDIRQRHTVRELQKHWGVSGYSIYNKLFKRFEIITRDKKASESKSMPEFTPKAIIEKEQEVIDVLGGFNIQLIGNFKGSEISNRIMSLADLVSDETMYTIFIELKERGGRECLDE